MCEHGIVRECELTMYNMYVCVSAYAHVYEVHVSMINTFEGL